MDPSQHGHWFAGAFTWQASSLCLDRLSPWALLSKAYEMQLCEVQPVCNYQILTHFVRTVNGRQ